MPIAPPASESSLPHPPAIHEPSAEADIAAVQDLRRAPRRLPHARNGGYGNEVPPGPGILPWRFLPPHFKYIVLRYTRSLSFSAAFAVIIIPGIRSGRWGRAATTL